MNQTPQTSPSGDGEKATDTNTRAQSCCGGGGGDNDEALSNLRSDNSFLTLQLLKIARILELPSDKTLDFLDEHTEALMKKLKSQN